MKNRIKPTVDCVFKAILGKKENENLLMNFLNALLEKAPGERIVHVSVLNPYNEREFEGAKLSIVDVKVQDESGNYYQIEVQVSIFLWLTARMLHNWASIYHAQLEKGAAYSSLNPLISIWILDGILFEAPREEDTDKYMHLAFECKERTLGIRLNDHFNLHILQLPYRNPLHTEMDDKERWIYFFKEGENMDTENLPDELDTPEIRQAMDVLERFSDNKEEYFLYQKRLESISVEKTWREALERKELELRQKDAQLKQKDSQLKQKDSQLKQKDSQLKQKDSQLKQIQEEKEHLLELLRKAGMKDEG